MKLIFRTKQFIKEKHWTVMKESKFKTTQLVYPKSNPNLIGPVIEVVFAEPENKYIVFINGNQVPYYESQLEAKKKRKALAGTCLAFPVSCPPHRLADSTSWIVYTVLVKRCQSGFYPVSIPPCTKIHKV